MTDLRAEDPGIHLRRERLSENCPHLAETAALRERVKELEGALKAFLLVHSSEARADSGGWFEHCECDTRQRARSALAAGSKEGA